MQLSRTHAKAAPNYIYRPICSCIYIYIYIYNTHAHIYESEVKIFHIAFIQASIT